MIVESTMWIVNFMANSPIGTYFVYKRDLWASILSIYIFCHLFVRERKQFWSFWYFSYLVFATVICFDLFSWKSFWINHEWNVNWRWPCVKGRLPSFLFYLISSALKHIKEERSMHFVHRIIGFRILQTYPHRAVPFQRHAAYLLGMYQFKGPHLFLFISWRNRRAYH